MFGNASCTVTLTEQMTGGLSATAPLSIVVTPGKAMPHGKGLAKCTAHFLFQSE
jgi:hypothetical protein